MKKTIFLGLLLLGCHFVWAQYLPGEAEKVTIDSSWYSKLDTYQQQGLEEWIENYNKGVEYYNLSDFESANFYFEKVLRRSIKELFTKGFWTGATKNNSTVELNENIYFFKYVGYLRMNVLPVKELERGFNKVKSHCPPTMTRIAVELTKEYNQTRKKKDRIDYLKFYD